MEIFLHDFASFSNIFHRLINYVKSFCANANRAKLKIVGSFCNTAADFFVLVMGRNGSESLIRMSRNQDTDINCGYIVIFLIYKCMDIVKVLEKVSESCIRLIPYYVMFMENFINAFLNSCSFACVPGRHFVHLPLKSWLRRSWHLTCAQNFRWFLFFELFCSVVFPLNLFLYVYAEIYVYWYKPCFLHSILQLSLEKKKEMQQYKEKALDLETKKRESRKKALLDRVQEIVENVQVVWVQSCLIDLHKVTVYRHFEIVLGFKYSPI